MGRGPDSLWWRAGGTHPLGHLATIRVVVVVLQHDHGDYHREAHDDHGAGEVLGCGENRGRVRPGFHQANITRLQAKPGPASKGQTSQGWGGGDLGPAYRVWTSQAQYFTGCGGWERVGWGWWWRGRTQALFSDCQGAGVRPAVQPHRQRPAAAQRPIFPSLTKLSRALFPFSSNEG